MMKKILAFLIAFALLFSVSINVFADGTPAQFDPQTAEKQDPIAPAKMNDNNVLNHTYRVYQVFTGTLAEDGETLGGINWGNGVNPGNCGKGGIIDNLYDDPFFGYVEDNIFHIELSKITTDKYPTTEEQNTEAARRIAEIVAGFGDYSEAATEFARAVYQSLSDKYYELDDDGKIIFVNDDPKPGYYVIIDQYDTSAGADPEEVANIALLRIVDPDKPLNITPKVDVPVLTKKVLDTNDSWTIPETLNQIEAWFAEDGSEDSENWTDSADYDIGDHVPFLITYKLGRISAFPYYMIKIEDWPDDGLTYDNNAIVKVDGDVCDELLPEPFIDSDGCITWYTGRFETKTATLVHDYSVITIEFTMTLNEEAVTGSDGNENWACATFPNDPNLRAGGSISSTPNAITAVFTYQARINKVDQDGKPLDGAEFELFKKIRKTTGSGREEGTDWEWVSLGNIEPTAITDPEDEETVISYTFDWKGIDDGDYKLTETKIPGGYNEGEDLFFTVSATHTANISFDEEEYVSFHDLNITVTGEDGSAFTIEEDEGELTGLVITNVKNQKGSVLPETGGIGTTIFYVAGGILVAVAGVLLITKKRIGNGPED